MNKKQRKRTVIISTGVVLMLSLVSPASAEIKTEFDEFSLFGIDCAPLHDSNDPLKGSPRAIVEKAADYWNLLTKRKLDLKIRYGEFNVNAPYTGFSGQLEGKEMIAFNMYYDNLVYNNVDYSFSYKLPGQILHGSGIDFFSLTTHEIGHSMGIKLDRDDDRIYPKDGSKWGDLIRDTEGNGINGLWISATPDPKGTETFTDKISRGVKYVFTGSAAAAVYGDVWMGGGKEAVNLPVEATYQFDKTNKDKLFYWGSSLVHPYTRFGNMNAMIESAKRPFFNEAELAVFRDLGQPVDIEGQFGHSVYTNGNTITNSDAFKSTNQYSIGLHIVGDHNVITQKGDLDAGGSAGAGIRIEGIDNKVLIPEETLVSANGEEGYGVLISHGDGAQLVNRGTIEAIGSKGVGVYLNSGTWSDDYWTVTNGKARQFDNTGSINAGTNDAIRLAGSNNDITINFMNGSRVNGHITAETGSKALLTFGKKAYADGTASEALDSDAVVSMNGNISGSSGITMNILSGKLTYTGTASIADAMVAAGAGLFGNATYNLPTLTNHGTLSPVAVSSGVSGELAINGNLVSDGKLGVAAYGDNVSKIIVSGNAAVNGSKVVMTPGSLYLPGKLYDILEAAGTISGTVQGGALTGLLDAKTANDGRTITVTTSMADNLGIRSAQQQQLHLLLQDMYNRTQSQELAKVFSLDAENTKQAFNEIAGGEQLGMAALTQSSTMAGQAIEARMTDARNNYVLGATSKQSGEEETIIIPHDVISFTGQAEGRWWLKLGKRWNQLGDNFNNHSSSVVLALDTKANENWTKGLFFAYEKSNAAGSSSKTDNQDFRCGLYTGYHKEARDWNVYADYGRQNNTAVRYLPTLGLKTDSHYHSKTIELGGEYKYDLNYNSKSIWHAKPYVKMQAVRYIQEGYQENGAGLFDQRVSSMQSNFIAGQAGIELSQQNQQGGITLKAGYKHVFTGEDPTVTVALAGSPDAALAVAGPHMDRNLLILGVSGCRRMAGGWVLDGKIEMERGAHDKNLVGEVTLKHMW